MKIKSWFWVPSILSLLLAGSWSFGADDHVPAAVGAEASAILAHVGRPVGLVHLPRCRNADLAWALLEAEAGLCVHGQMLDEEPIRVARAQADEKGFFGRRVWFDLGSLDRLLPVGNSCDLVVMTDLTADDLTARLADEISRVLHPWYGMAMLAGDVTGDALEKWAEAFRRSGVAARVLKQDSSSLSSAFPGPLLEAKKPGISGADDWPLWWHGPDNNAVSEDTGFYLPATMQWTGKPFFPPTRVELPLVAEGRLFMLWNGHVMDSSRGMPIMAGFEDIEDTPEAGPFLTAQAVGSGQRLWVRQLSSNAWMQVSRSVMAVDGERVLIADGGTLLALDAASGEARCRVDTGTEEIKWMTLAGDKIFVMGGSKTRSRGRRSVENVAPFRKSGLSLMAYENKSLRALWHVDREQGADAFDPRSPAVAGGKLFVCSEVDTAQAIDIETGRLLWQTKAGFERNAPHGYEWDFSSRHPVSGYALENVYVISGPEMTNAVVLSQADGSRLWTKETRGQGMWIPLAFGGLLSGIDPLTGRAKDTSAGSKMIKSSCARETTAPFVLKYGYAPPENIKSACGAGTIVADGLLWKTPTPCSACVEWRGFLVQAPQADAPPPGPRLYQSGKTDYQTQSQPKGWTQYRANVQRSNYVPFDVPGQPRICWQEKPVPNVGILSAGRDERGFNNVLMEPEYVLTPPVAADNRIVVGHAEGSIHAFALGTGERLWRAYVSGRIHSSPAVWKDRVFVGCTDGYLYAFALEDGHDLWRLRVAPQTGRMMVYGQLGSRWPVVCSPLVFDDKVVVSAGLVDMVDGVYAVCADAQTGRILWEQNDWSASSKSVTMQRVSGGAQFALGRELFYHGGHAPPIRIDPRDGSARTALPPEVGERLGGWHIGKWKSCQAFARIASDIKGQDIGVISPRWLAFGGRRIWTDQSEDGTWRATTRILGRDEQGQGQLPALAIAGTALLPAWDDDDVLFFAVKGVDEKLRHLWGTVSIPRDKFADALEKAMPEKSTADILAIDDQRPHNGMSIPPEYLLKEVSITGHDLAGWKSTIPWGWGQVACAMTRNAVLIALAGTETRLVALDRTDGTQMWDIKLPGIPLHDGLVVAADGTIILVQRDGTIFAVGREPADPAATALSAQQGKAGSGNTTVR